MIPLSTVHTHSDFSDGKNTLEEMLQAAIEKGFVAYGFSDHAWAPYDEHVCVKREEMSVYLAECERLREKYKDVIEVYIGFEFDAYGPRLNKEDLDFTIGSVHYWRGDNGEYHPVDHLPEHFETARDRLAGGDIRELLRRYYDIAVSFAEDFRPDIVGHIDLVTKFNRNSRYFDEDSSWYRALITETADRLKQTGCMIEVNTGGISRGYVDKPYPSRDFLKLFLERDVPVLLSSDAHSTDAVDCFFDESLQILREVGYRSIRQMRGGKFIEVGI